jgi:hypothetical protein
VRTRKVLRERRGVTAEEVAESPEQSPLPLREISHRVTALPNAISNGIQPFPEVRSSKRRSDRDQDGI